MGRVLVVLRKMTHLWRIFYISLYILICQQNKSIDLKARARFAIQIYQSGLCDTCSEAETIEYVLLHCAVYTKEREELFKKLSNIGVIHFTVSNILSCASGQTNIMREIISFLKITGLESRI